MIIRRNSKIEKLCFLTLMFIAFFSCTDDKDHFDNDTEGLTYIPSGDIFMWQLLGGYSGDEADCLVLTFRALVFEKIDTYDFAFLATDSTCIEVQQALNGISECIDLDAISYPAAASSSKNIIPMMQTIEDIEVLQKGKTKITSGETQSLITLKLRRLGAQTDVLLKTSEWS